ncbi:MAG: malto-oligosyltrehalose trehalohydrolase [Chloroflexota bacterium]
MESSWRLPLGAELDPEGVVFRVWAPAARQVEVALYGEGGTRYLPLRQREGVWEGLAPGLEAGARYKFRLDGRGEFPDPYSRYQPEGVHGPSAVVDPAQHEWRDAAWGGLQPEGQVIYEIHLGTYTPGGTCDDLIPELAELARLGVTALQIMPVNESPGRWNWGYDGVDLYAPSRNYGGPEALKRLVDAAHGAGLGVILDVVYSHLGPDGNYLSQYSPDYFTNRYTTPWGQALNFDGPGSHWVREFVIQNACYWLREYHVDALRLDATHAIFDRSRPHILAELAERARVVALREPLIIAEDNRNDARLIHGRDTGGLGLDILYADDFHHEVTVLLTGARDGYYADYQGTTAQVARAVHEVFTYQGQSSPYLGTSRGTPRGDEPAWQFLVCLQNHDQVGNRALGERLHHLVGQQRFLAATALLLLVPQTPLLFMGEEFAASSPFLYFTDHEPELGKLVTAGRRREFRRFAAFADPGAAALIPDPQAESTFRRSKLQLSERQSHAGAYRLYADLLALRRQDAVFGQQDRHNLTAAALSATVLALRFWQGDEQRLLLVNFGEAAEARFWEADVLAALPEEQRHLLWTSADPRYGLAAEKPPLGERVGDVLRLPAWSATVLGPREAMVT